MKRSWLIVTAFLTIMALASISHIQAEVLGAWTTTSNYPITIGDPSCVSHVGYMYCVGGLNSTSWIGMSTVYSASLSGGNVDPWSNATNTAYPYPVQGQSCAADSEYIYCVGGAPYTWTSAYSASLSDGTASSWTYAGAYPIPFSQGSCAIDSGYIYCVGGGNGSGSLQANVYSATASGGYVAYTTPWSSANAYPTSVSQQSCAIYGGYIYCVGGWTATGVTAAVYSATVSSGNVGSWSNAATHAYPFPVSGHSCAIDSGYIYCVGGDTGSGYTAAVYYASVSGGSVGAWESASVYPISVMFHSCAIDSGYIYCVGGQDSSYNYHNDVYSTPILPTIFATALASITSSTSTTSSATVTSGTAQLQVSTGTLTVSAEPEVTSTLLTTTTVTGSVAGTGTITFTSILSTSYSTSSSVASSSATVTQTGTTTTSTSQTGATTSTGTAYSTTTSAGTVTVTETNTFNVLITQIYWELEQLETLILQFLGFQVTATPVGQQVNQVIVTTTTTPAHVTMTVSYSCPGGGSGYSAPVFHYVLNGVSKTLTLTKTAKSLSVDSGSSWSVTPNPLTGSTSSQWWYATPSTVTGTATSSTHVFAFQHQYYLTMKASGPGTVTPSSGWYNPGAKVTIKAKPNSGHTFNKWTGSGTGSYTGTSATHTITMNAAITETATFT